MEFFGRFYGANLVFFPFFTRVGPKGGLGVGSPLGDVLGGKFFGLVGGQQKKANWGGFMGLFKQGGGSYGKKIFYRFFICF